ncbi:MAG: hypothetical protein EVJ46_07780 [Candidatus Acididesulfobacter guangdongensis]|uniref:Uncharacterized protein n=1 Tax=Acididesulfobacter guangdongensis TaxID=2597225 RepID=A0A519BFN9_ACIG2|nr:MAG: hypothetical protein EVJ46_07780 [Candidatus Acididesulfobacter guangdongensis]
MATNNAALFIINALKHPTSALGTQTVGEQAESPLKEDAVNILDDRCKTVAVDYEEKIDKL